MGVSVSVDLFFEWAILDRGDEAAPEPIFPVLTEGFDQQQLIFGFMRRFPREREPQEDEGAGSDDRRAPRQPGP